VFIEIALGEFDLLHLAQQNQRRHCTESGTRYPQVPAFRAGFSTRLKLLTYLQLT
jgi:hypothetical protein